MKIKNVSYNISDGFYEDNQQFDNNLISNYTIYSSKVIKTLSDHYIVISKIDL